MNCREKIKGASRHLSIIAGSIYRCGMSLEVSTKKIQRNGKTFSATMLEMKNAIFIFFVEGEEAKIGTLVLALPVMIRESFIIMGERFATLARILAEKLAVELGKISLVSVAVDTLREDEAGPIFAKLFKQILRRT